MTQLTLVDHNTNEEILAELLKTLEPIDDVLLAQAIAGAVVWALIDNPPYIETFLNRWPNLICPYCHGLHRSVSCDEKYMKAELDYD